MKRLALLFSLLIIISCEDKKDTTPPTVLIEAPTPNKTISGLVTIQVSSEDNEGIHKIDFFIDSQYVESDSLAPYEYEWDTSKETNGEHVIKVNSYDLSDNMTESESVNITVDNFIRFIKTFGGDGHDQGHSVKHTNDNGYIITGSTQSFGSGKSDLWLLKTDSTGNEEWNKTFGGSDDDNGNSIQQTADGGYIITGYTKSFGNGDFDVWLIKTDSNGNEEWSKTFGGSDKDVGREVHQTKDGGYIISGGTVSFSNDRWYDVWLIKTDSQGNEEWNQTFGGEWNDWGHSVQQTTDGGYIITGLTPNSGYNDLWLIKTDSQGIEEWNQTFGGGESEQGNSVQQTTDGGYIITGRTDSYGPGSQDVWLLKTDSQGKEEWNKTFGTTANDLGFSVQQTIDNGYIITGYQGGPGWRVILIKTNSMGIEEWTQKPFSSESNGDWGFSVDQNINGNGSGFIITGFTGYGSNENLLLIKTGPKGNAILPD